MKGLIKKCNDDCGSDISDKVNITDLYKDYAKTDGFCTPSVDESSKYDNKINFNFKDNT